MIDDEHGVKPAPGKVCLFDHNIYHCGGKVNKGEKYSMRADILYYANPNK